MISARSSRGIGHRTFKLDSERFEPLLSHMRALRDYRAFGLPRDRPRLVDLSRVPRCPIRAPYDARGAGSRSDAFPCAGEGFYIGTDELITDADLYEYE